MSNPSDEIKSKLDIVDVIREYIQLKVAGLNFRALCPFHREKSPSFIVSPEKQIWHCFGCGKGGDIFSFVMEIEGLNFVETLRLLAKKAGVVLKKADPALTSKRNALLDILELSAKYYHKILTGSPAAEAARQYLRERALTDETIVKWQIGYSPDSWDSLAKFLKSRGFLENEIFLAGLSVKKNTSTDSGRAGFYDRFRGRIMFPINDINGNIAGFSARVLPASDKAMAGKPEENWNEKMGKYINTPATMIYDKSKILFGLDKAKMAIKAEDAAVLVEGQMDAIMAEQNGFKNVIASSGTALTAEQVNLIKRYSNNLFLSFDMDKAGDLAAERGIAQAMRAEMNIKVIEINGAKDADECIRNNSESWRQAVENAKPMMRYYFDKTFAGLNLKDYQGQSQAEKILLPVISSLGSITEQDYWLKKLSQEIDAQENSLREKLREIINLSAQAGKQNQAKPPAQTLNKAPEELSRLKPSREQMLSELLLAFILRFPAYLEYAINHIGPDDLVGRSNQLLYENLIIYYNNLIDLWTQEGGNFELAISYLNLKEWLSNSDNLVKDGDDKIDGQPDNYKCLNLLDRLVLLADKDFYDYTEEQVKAEIINIVAALKVNCLNNRRRETAKLIAALEKENISGQEKNERLKKLMEELKTLTEEINLIEIR